MLIAKYVVYEKKLYTQDGGWKFEYKIKKKYIYNDKYFEKKICSINRDLRKYYASS
jgi:hypothetical protein